MATQTRKPPPRRARSAITGRFMRLIDALRDKLHSVIERIRRRR